MGHEGGGSAWLLQECADLMILETGRGLREVPRLQADYPVQLGAQPGQRFHHGHGHTCLYGSAVVRGRACPTTSSLFPSPSRGLSSTRRKGEAGAETAPGCAVEAQAQGRRQDGGRGLWERKRGFPGGGGAKAADWGREGGGRGPGTPLPILP